MPDAVCADYLKFLIEHYDRIAVRGVPQTVRNVTLPIEEVYVSLTAERENPKLITIGVHGDGEIFWQIPIGPVESKIKPLDDLVPAGGRINRYEPMQEFPIELPRVVRENHRVIFLGDPGAGKTTLLHFLTVRCAAACRSRTPTITDKEANRYGETRLPIYLRVSQFADALRKDHNLDLRSFLHRACGFIPIPAESLRALFDAAFREGRALVLLDGLDEVADEGDRADVLRGIEQFVSGMGAENRILVTSRIAGYQSGCLGSAFQQATLRDMEREQIERFLTRWCAATERFHRPDADETTIATLADTERTSLLAAIDASPGVQKLAKNPLLLTILALIHRGGGRLPQRRVELYEIAAKTLLRDWRLAQAGAAARVIEEYEAEELLGPLAYYMHEHEPTGLIHEDDMRRLLREWHAEARNLRPTHADVKAAVEDFLKRIREQSGLLVERAPKYYGFMHLTFEEYFAAQHILSDFATAPDRIRPHRHKPRWEEPIRLAIASERPKNAAFLIRAAIWHKDGEQANTGYVPSQYEEILRRDLLLAAHCLGDCAATEPTLSEEVTSVLVEIALNRDNQGGFEGLRKVAASALSSLACGEASAGIQERLLEALQDEEVHMRGIAAAALGQIGQPSEVVINALILALRDKDGYVSLNAASALGQLGLASDIVINALIQALQDEVQFKSPSAAFALGQLGRASEAVTNALLHALKSKARIVRSSAALALGQLGQATEDVINALLQALRDDDSVVSGNAASALRQLGQASEAVINTLLHALREKNLFLRANAASALGQLGQATDVVIKALLQTMQDDDSLVRRSAASALGQLGQASEVVINTLLKALQDSDSDLRGNAALALGQLGPASGTVIGALLHALGDNDDFARGNVTWAIGQLGLPSEAVTNALLQMLDDKVWIVRMHAVSALGQLGQASQAVTDALLQALRDKASDVQNAAWEALSKIV